MPLFLMSVLHVKKVSLFYQISTDSLGDLQAHKGDKLTHCSLRGNLFEKQSSICVLNILEL